MSIAAAVRSQPSWPDGLRWQAQLLATMAAAGAVVAIFGGGAYMGSRLSATSGDELSRMAHWQRSLRLLDGSDWLLGKGMGRYWAEQVATGRDDDQTGDYRLLAPAPGRDSQALVLTSGLHNMGSAAQLAMSQRVPLPAPGLATISLRVRAERSALLNTALCSKHLLYADGCQGMQFDIAAKPGEWQTLRSTFRGATLDGGAGYAPRLSVFTMSLGRQGNRIEIDDVQLLDAAGNPLLKNGDFEQGLARWYFTSDKYHMPFHTKNLAVHLLFEQGLLGLGAFALLAAAALWRTSFGAARDHRLAPLLAAGIVGLLTVGLVDSVMDMPRAAFLTLLMLALAVALPRAGPRLKAAPGA